MLATILIIRLECIIFKVRVKTCCSSCYLVATRHSKSDIIEKLEIVRLISPPPRMLVDIKSMAFLLEKDIKMPNTIDMKPEAKDIKSYLILKQGEEFVIPSYQRAYNWNTEEHCDKLLEDLFDYIENNGSDYDAYFFGNLITVTESNDQLIIDGQQRTTTFLLLLKALHYILEDYVLCSNSLNEDCNDMIKDRLKEVLCVLYKIDKNNIASFIRNFKYEDCHCILSNDSMNETDFDDWPNIFGACNYRDAESKVKKRKRAHKDNKYTNFFSES